MANDTTKRPGGSGLILDRRELMAGAAALGLGFGLGFQGGPAMAQDAPKKGGTLRLGMEGGSASDSLDPRTYADSILISYGWQICNGLTEVDEKGDIAGELFESWEVKPGAKEWIFNVRKGVTFSNGKTLDADDVHLLDQPPPRRDEVARPRAPVSRSPTSRSCQPNQIAITLADGNADLPGHPRRLPHHRRAEGLHRLGSKPDRHRRLCAGELRAGRARRSPRSRRRTTGRPGRGNFDAVELRYIQDAGRPHAALHVGRDRRRQPPRRAHRQPGDEGRRTVNVVRTKGTGNRFASWRAATRRSLHQQGHLRLALKYGIDREKIIDTVYSGFATIGNDHNHRRPRAKYLHQRRAAASLRSGQGRLPLQEGRHGECRDRAAGLGRRLVSAARLRPVLYQEAMKKAGIDLNVKKRLRRRLLGQRLAQGAVLRRVLGPPPDRRQPAVADLPVERRTGTTPTGSAPEFDKLIIEAPGRARRGASARRCTSKAQEMIADDGGMICFAIGDYLDGYSKKVQGTTPHPPLRHVRPAHRRKGLVRLSNLSAGSAGLTLPTEDGPARVCACDRQSDGDGASEVLDSLSMLTLLASAC